MWDSPRPEDKAFWYSVNTTLLFYTETWKLGQDQVATMSISATPSTFIEKENQPTWYFLGFPLSFESKTYKTIDWAGEKMLNKDLRVALKSKDEVSGNDMVANVNFDFTERQYTLHFYKIKDMLTSVGGIRSSVLPVIGFVLPFAGLWFLILLADIILRNATKN